MSAEAETTASTVVAVSSSKYVTDDVDPSKGASASNPNYMTWQIFSSTSKWSRPRCRCQTPFTEQESVPVRPENPIRKIAITIAHHPWFDRFILFFDCPELCIYDGDGAVLTVLSPWRDYC